MVVGSFPYQLQSYTNLKLGKDEVRLGCNNMEKNETKTDLWCGPDQLKLAGPLLEDSLIHLINLSIRKRTFSGKWKPQLIFPHHKKK